MAALGLVLGLLRPGWGAGGGEGADWTNTETLRSITFGVIVVDLMLLPAFVVVTWVAEMGLETVVTGTLVAVVTGVVTGLLEVMVVAKVLVLVVLE